MNNNRVIKQKIIIHSIIKMYRNQIIKINNSVTQTDKIKHKNYEPNKLTYIKFKVC